MFGTTVSRTENQKNRNWTTLPNALPYFTLLTTVVKFFPTSSLFFSNSYFWHGKLYSSHVFSFLRACVEALPCNAINPNQCAHNSFPSSGNPSIYVLEFPPRNFTFQFPTRWMVFSLIYWFFMKFSAYCWLSQYMVGSLCRSWWLNTKYVKHTFDANLLDNLIKYFL